MLLSAYGAETVYYVSPAGDGTDGATWATAFRHPQDAVDAAAAAANPDGARVVIADATYKVRNASDAAVVKISAGSIALEPQNAGGHGVIIDGGTETTTGSGNVLDIHLRRIRPTGRRAAAVPPRPWKGAAPCVNLKHFRILPDAP